MSDEPVEIPKHSFGGARLMTDKERETIRCGFGAKISAEDKAKIAAAWDAIEEKPHRHIWTNWLQRKDGGAEFRRCIECKIIQERGPAK